MTRPYDSRHVPWDPKQPRPKSWSPGGIEYYDTELQSDSDSMLSSSQESFSPPSGVKSLDDLREAFKQSEIPNRDPIYPTYSVSTTSEHGDRNEESPSDVEEVCENCLGMNAENLAQPDGYKHSIFSEFSKSIEWCRLCMKMESNLKLRRVKVHMCTPDRYQIVVFLGDTGKDVKVQPGSTRRRRCRPFTGHGLSGPRFHNTFSQLWFEVVDLRPWLVLENGMEEVFEPMNQLDWTPLAPDGSELRVVTDFSLTCLTEEYDPLTELGVEYIRQIGSDTSSSRSFQIAALWLASCLDAEKPPRFEDWKPPKHYEYDPDLYPGPKPGGSKSIAREVEAVSFPAQDPLRLVEIQPGTKGSAPTIRLIHTDGHHYRYAALSYCWGKAQPGDSRPWQTKHATLKSHLQGIDRRQLPQTLQDAVSICEGLYITYLWVDSLCIIQDSPSDWAAEAAKMSGIYLGSLLTISLSASDSVDAGCFNHVSQRYVESEDFQRSWIKLDTRLGDGRATRLFITSPALAMSDGLFQKEVESGVLSQRAWVLQERVMPQRTLYVTSAQLLWECRHCRLSEENYPQQQTDSLYPICNYAFPLDETAIIEMWYKRVVENYTRRQLTYEEDRLVAISALARATYLNRKIGYVAGLWRDCIVPGLLWMRRGPGSKSKKYSCPSWSWASQNSAVWYYFATPSSVTHPSQPSPSYHLPIVQDVSWETKPENPFGDVLFAHVDLDTTITLGTVLRDDTFNDERRPRSEMFDQTLVIPEPGRKETFVASAAMDDAERGGRNVVVANMGHCLLLLEPPSLSSKEYRRVGLAVFNVIYNHDKVHELKRGWTRRAIRLV